MPTGPKGQKRPADVIGNAVLIARIATSEADDATPDDGKDKALGKKGRAARGQVYDARTSGGGCQEGGGKRRRKGYRPFQVSPSKSMSMVSP
ncbi:MAG: hypothetical protein ABI697_10885 [Devosia sp.]